MLPMSGKVAVLRPFVCVWVIGIGLCLTLSGCLAQKADMTRMGKTLDRKIAKLDAREKALQQNIEEAEKKIARQSKEAERLVRLVTEARARLRQDITELREESLPILHGKLEETGHYLKRNREHIAPAICLRRGRPPVAKWPSRLIVAAARRSISWAPMAPTCVG